MVAHLSAAPTHSCKHNIDNENQHTMTLTIDITPEDEPRVTEAFGSILNLQQPAAAADLQAACSQWMGNQTQDYERRKNMQTFTPPPLVLNEPVELPPPEPGRSVNKTTTKKKK